MQTDDTIVVWSDRARLDDLAAIERILDGAEAPADRIRAIFQEQTREPFPLTRYVSGTKRAYWLVKDGDWLCCFGIQGLTEKQSDGVSLLLREIQDNPTITIGCDEVAKTVVQIIESDREKINDQRGGPGASLGAVLNSASSRPF